MTSLGTGWAFPVSVSSGGLQTREGLDHLRQSIMMILMTRKGERVMRPWFGSNLWQHLDSPINRTTLAAMRYEIFMALREETRMTMKQIKITNPEPHHLVFTVVILLDKGITEAVQIAYNRELKRWEGIWQESQSLSSS